MNEFLFYSFSILGDFCLSFNLYTLAPPGDGLLRIFTLMIQGDAGQMIHVFLRRKDYKGIAVRYVRTTGTKIDIDTGVSSVTLKKWVNFKIVQYRSEDEGEYVYKIFVNGEEIFATKFTKVDVNRNLKAYLGHPNKSFQQYKGRIADLYIDGERYGTPTPV